MVIHIKKLTKQFPSRKGTSSIPALMDVNLTVERGAVCGIIGTSGAGKSTLMRCLTGLDTPSSGSVWIDGEEITALNGRALRAARRKIGMIFQHFNLFSAKPIWQNVAYPLEIEGVSLTDQKKKALELLETVGLKHKAHAYPAQLSGGEKQRVAIARALASDPVVLLCDEATSALDPGTTLTILHLLEELNRSLGLTIVLITHEMDVVKQICTQVAVLEGGKIVEQGSVDALFSSPEHPTTRQFLGQLTHDIPPHFRHRKGHLFRLFFKGESAEKPIISQMIKKFDVDVNILLGGVDALRTVTVGTLVVELTGLLEEREKARAFLETQGVICEEVEF